MNFWQKNRYALKYITWKISAFWFVFIIVSVLTGDVEPKTLIWLLPVVATISHAIVIANIYRNRLL